VMSGCHNIISVETHGRLLITPNTSLFVFERYKDVSDTSNASVIQGVLEPGFADSLSKTKKYCRYCGSDREHLPTV
jgi:hypothetical protein